ncbi:MAG: hypothetical protein J2O48_00285 [Solirubrobacterales bacterium]|nr:hypothetical protein [Solirubrobacterales bacterium]
MSTRRFGAALMGAIIVSLAFAISAYAGPGVGGPGLVTAPDTAPQGYGQPPGYKAPANDGLGVKPGAIKHVWVITMENHAFESNFSGLNNNTYLSQTLPKYGALLTNYYGTGHSSLDNYLSGTSGQAPVTDNQGDCPAYTKMSGSVDTSGGSLSKNGNYGQFSSAAGPNAPTGDNGCVYPSSVPTLFNQLDAHKVSWKTYAQDVDTPGPTGQNAGIKDCGAPDATAGDTPSANASSNPKTTSPVVGAASATDTDQYVAKHNPLAWFGATVGSGDCAKHLAPLFGAHDQLYKDLQNAKSTPAFNYIVPNNCSNGHDAICYGTNLSGGFNGQTPKPNINNVGGTYSADNFLGHVIPEIQKSPAYADGGLIAVVWDEAYPQFTYSNDTLANSSVSNATAFNSLTNDQAGETLFGRSLNWEPSGPNTPNVFSQAGQAMSGGPGYGSYLDRPGKEAQAPLVPCTHGTANATNGYLTVPGGGCYDGQGSNGPGAQDQANNASFTASYGNNGVVSESASGSDYALVTPNEQGKAVTLPAGVTASANPVYVGQVKSAPPKAIGHADQTASDQASSASFQLVDASGNPVTLSGSGSGKFGLAAETAANDPLYNAFDPTNGGGDSGAVLLSPYIKGGTVSNTYYNHYSLLRSLEDIFSVSKGSGKANGYTGSINVSKGLDKLGHLGYAAQAGLAPFGKDIFTNAPVDPSTVKVSYDVVPRVTGHSLAGAKLLLSGALLHTGKVTSPKAKKGYHLVVASQAVKAQKVVARDSKIALKLKLVRNGSAKKKPTKKSGTTKKKTGTTTTKSKTTTTKK